MSYITVRQAILSDLDDLVPIFDNYRQLYGYEQPGQGNRTDVA